MGRAVVFTPLMLLVALAGSGCASIGVQRVAVDRSAYTERLRESEKEQLLSNIVGLRYGDAPLFLRVSSVINQITREASGRLDASIAPPTDSEHGSLGGTVLLREAPTITYTPMAGDAFARAMLSPLPPTSLLAMMETGWAADDLLVVTARSINGVANVTRAPLFEQPGNAELAEAVAALRRLQRSGAISLRLVEGEKVLHSQARLAETLTAAEREDIERVRRILGVRLDGGEVQLVFSAVAPRAGQVAIATRSMLEVLSELAQGVDVTGEGRFDADDLIRIHSGTQRPAQAYATARSHDRWFWIAADDAVSVRRFLLVQVLVSLTNDSEGARAPLVTIPIG